MIRTALLAGSLFTIGLTGCTTFPEVTEVGEQSMVESITGALIYRERIALPKGATAEIVVSDITLGSDQELILSREIQPLEQSRPPIPFTINISKLNLSDGPLYGLRAFIREPSGSIMFRTTEPLLIDLSPNNLNVGNVMLGMTSPGDLGMAGTPNLKDGAWRITQIGSAVVPQQLAPEITFGADDRVYGTTSCNDFRSSYELLGSSLRLGAVAVTQRTCEPDLMAQERRFLDALSMIETASLDRDGLLVLTGSGQRLVAIRK